MTLQRAAACALLIAGSTFAVASQKPVPDEATAIALAEKKLIPIYGKKQIQSEEPFRAKLERNTWHVWGYLPLEDVGGVAEIWIDARSGKVLKVTHGK